MTVRAAVFTGGGADGAFQVGALNRAFWLELYGKRFHHVSGVSTGSLTGSLLACGDTHEEQRYMAQRLRAIYLALRGNKDIYTGGGWFGAKAWNLFRRGYIHKPTGLKTLLRQHLDVARLRTSATAFTCGVVNVETGVYGDVPKSDWFIRDYILASASMPVLFPTVNVAGQPFVDGGVRNITPLSSAVKFLAAHPDPDKEVWLFLASPLRVDLSTATKGLPLLGRTLELAFNEVYLNDLAMLERLNGVQGYANIRAMVVCPDEEFGDALDFNPKRIARTMAAGEAAIPKEWVTVPTAP